MVKRWLFVISEYQFDIVHTSGVDNHWADMLSRLCPHQSPTQQSAAQPTDDPVAVTRIDHTDLPSINSLREVAQRDLPIFSNWLSRIHHGIHQQVAAGDKEEHVITEVLDQFDSPEGPMCSVLWYGGDITAVATSSIENTKAFMAFKKNNNNPCIDQRKRSSSKANPDKTPIANRTRRRTGSKKQSAAQPTDDPVAVTRIDHTDLPSINSLREVAQRDLPIFSNWLSRIRSEQFKAIESNEPSSTTQHSTIEYSYI
ncbi:hypothetical protein GEMRC1_006412 [Eukaryota sp. GEM-RC1]